MKRRTLTKRVDDLLRDNGLRFATGHRWVSIEITACATQAEYDRAFVQAWEQVPPGAVVFHFPQFTEQEFQHWIQRENQGLPPLIQYRMGIFLKISPQEFEQ